MSRRAHDTVARWIALTVLIAMITALAFNALFVQLAGVWARPPLIETGLLEKVAVVVRVVEASEPAQRSHLANVMGDASFRVTWAAQRAAFDLPALADPDFNTGEQVFKHLLEGPTRPMEVYEPADWPNGKGQYVLLIQLADQSWLMFSTGARSWGLDEGPRSLIVALLVLISTALVTLVATRPWPARCNTSPKVCDALAVTSVRRRSTRWGLMKSARRFLPSTACRRSCGTSSRTAPKCSPPSPTTCARR